MEIVSVQFVGFVALALLVYYFLPLKAQNIWLLAVSFIFLATWTVWSTLVLLAVIVGTYWVVGRLTRSQTHKQFWFIMGLGFNLLFLVSYRLVDSEYFSTFSRLGGVEEFASQVTAITIMLRIGLVFYSLQAIAYVVEAYNGRAPVEVGFIDFALYLAYFPKLLSGPIERPRAFLSQLNRPRIVDNAKLTSSLTLILVGLVRKIVVADLLPRMLPDYLRGSDTAGYHSLDLWLWLLVYAFTLYNDFAGYTSIVRGVSLLFGIELSPNFSQPFFARSFSEFWSRWHISLSLWLRDHIYFPVSRWLRRKEPDNSHWLNVVVPPMLTMLASGMWHGLTISMLLWGGLHGLYQVGERIVLMRWPNLKPTEGPWPRQLLAGGIVFTLTTLAWVPFALQSLRGDSGAFALWAQLLWRPQWSISDPWLLLVLVPIALSLGLDWTQFRGRSETAFLQWPQWAQAFALSSAVILLCVFGILNTSSVFIYQGF